ncbi:MAG: alpha/beta fold hydrolase [Chloroflexi bacterium]|nr:alpha/beta fold hydrolase [Chloroflexota bacterium]
MRDGAGVRPTFQVSNGKHYWRNLLLFTLVVILIGALVGGVWLAHAHAMNLVHPGRSISSRAPTHYETVTFKTSDGLRLDGWFISTNAPRSPAFVFVHGLGANRGAFVDQAAMVVRIGYAALLIDLRNHGKSEGAITTLGYAEVEDVRAAVQYLLTRSDVDPERIGLVGHSMGAGTVLRAAARIPDVRMVIAESAYTSIEDNIADGVRGLTGLPPVPFAPLIIWFGERETGMDIRQVRPIDDVPQISPRGVMLIHGAHDALIPVRNSQKLYQAAHEPKQLYIVPNADHNSLYAANPQEFERQVMTFLPRADMVEKQSSQSGANP